jgi:hypothetical protein
MPLDGEEHARAQDENLEWKEDYREPIPHFGYSRLFTICREEHYLKAAAYNISHLDADEITAFPSHGKQACAPHFRGACPT